MESNAVPPPSPNGTGSQRIAVIGAGISGLSAARVLQDSGHKVEVFDKGRGVGGRTSVRRHGPYAFDHGAQYFTARDPRFRAQVDMWVQEGVVAPFDAELAVIDGPGQLRPRTETDTQGTCPERFVGIPGMNAMAVHMAKGLSVRVATKVVSLDRDEAPGQWGLTASKESPSKPLYGTPYGPPYGPPYDWVLVTAPPIQTARLIAASAPLHAVADSVAMTPCWSVMVAFDKPLSANYDGAFINAGALSWVARNSNKPGRPAGDAWVLHGSAEWSAANLHLSQEEAAAALIEAFARATNQLLPKILHSAAHRWMYSSAAPPRQDEAHVDRDLQLGIAGDWLGGSKIQGAWLSGQALAAQVHGTIANTP